MASGVKSPLELDRFQVMNSYAKSIDQLAKGDLQLAMELSYWIIQYGIYGKEPPENSNPFMLATFEQIKKPIETCRAKSGNAKKDWESRLNQTEIKSKSNENQTERKEKKENIKDKENKESVSKEFEIFWKEFPHARKGKKADSYKYFKLQTPYTVMYQVNILKWKIKAGLQDPKYIPACERRIRDFTVLNEDVVKQELFKICKWHLNAGGDIKQRALELKETFGENEINETVKAIQKKSINLSFN